MFKLNQIKFGNFNFKTNFNKTFKHNIYKVSRNTRLKGIIYALLCISFNQ